MKNEIGELGFGGNYRGYLGYCRNKEKGMGMGFENRYEVKGLWEGGEEVGFLGVRVDWKEGKVRVVEWELEGYGGMFVEGDGKEGLKGVFGGYGKKRDLYGWGKEEYVRERED